MQATKIRVMLSVLAISGTAALAGCGGSPPQTVSTTTEETTTAPAATPMPAPMPGTPGTVTTQTTHTQTVP